MKTYKARAEIPDREWLNIEVVIDESDVILEAKVHAIGCHQIIDIIPIVKSEIIGKKLDQINWAGPSHADLMVSEIFLKLQNKFEIPVKDAELCHCRKILTSIVDNAIVMGAHSPEKVRAWTSASSGCGTCRPEVEKIINFRLKKA
jgi:bacterioferritin-associated ferredoxin